MITQLLKRPGLLQRIEARIALLTKQRKYASTQINLPADIAGKILELSAALIPDSDLVGKGRELHAHITVRFGVEEDEAKLQVVLAKFEPFTVTLGKVKIFEPTANSEDTAPVVVEVVSKTLHKLNRAIAEAMAAKKDDFDYAPHVTLAYVKPEAAEKYDGSAGLEGISFRVERIALSRVDGTQVEFPLGEKKIAKRKHPHRIIHGNRLSPQSILAKRNLERVANNGLKAMLPKVVAAIAAELTKVMGQEPKGKKRKPGDLIRKATAAERASNRIMKQLQGDFGAISEDAFASLEEAVLAGSFEGALQVQVTDGDLLATINKVAREWASNRAAELVGMRRNQDGDLVRNPDAKWVITESTRNDLNIIITDVFQREAPTREDIEARIQQAGTFSDARAANIAKTEIAFAQGQGNLTAWRESGQVNTVDWLVSGDHDHDDECDENEANGPYDMDEVPDFPAHPGCECVLAAGDIEEE